VDREGSAVGVTDVVLAEQRERATEVVSAERSVVSGLDLDAEVDTSVLQIVTGVHVREVDDREETGMSVPNPSLICISPPSLSLSFFSISILILLSLSIPFTCVKSAAA